MAKSPLSQLLRSIAHQQHGRATTPRTHIILGPYGNPNGCGSNGYCEYYWSDARRKMSFETWLRVARLSNRYRRFCRYVKEVLPEWRVERVINYADNSVEAVERNKFGQTRQRVLEAPRGDACF